MSSGAGAAWPWHGQGGAQGGTFTSRCAMLMECRYWMASPMLFMISEASEAAKKPSGAFTSRVKTTPWGILQTRSQRLAEGKGVFFA